MARVAPVHARQVDILLRAQIQPLRRATLRGNHAELDQHVRIAGGRIALLDDVGAIRVHLEALLDRHRAFVDAGEGDGRVIRRPPVAGVAIHFLVGDELGHAVADRVRAVAGQLDFLAAGQIDHPQVALAHEADEASLGRNLRIGGETAAVGQLAHRVGPGLAQVVQVQLAAQREQQALAVRRELVVDDARQRGDALALAACLFFIAQGLGAGQNHLGIHQHPGLPAGDVVLPQIQLETVVLLAAQEGHPLAVRRGLGLHQRRTGQRRIASQGFQGEFFCVGGGHGGNLAGGRQAGGQEKSGQRAGERFLHDFTGPWLNRCLRSSSVSG